MPRTTTRLAKTAVTAGALLAVAGLTGAHALAATTYTVTAGTKKTGTVNYTGKTKVGTADSPGIYFKDKTSGLALGCNSGTAAGTANLGPAVAGAALASIASSTWNGCTGPLGLQLSVAQVGTWSINAKGATNATSGVTKGSVSNVSANVSGNGCNFSVTGAVDGSYSNSTGALKVATVAGTGNVLKISNVDGCFGQINNGDVVIFKASYKVSTPAGKLSIVSNA